MPEQAPTLRDMIKEAVDRGLTYERLAKNAVDPQSGYKASAGYMNEIARDKVNRLPEPKSLRAIAAGLGVSYERVRVAAIAQWLPPEGETAEGRPDEIARAIEDARALRAGLANAIATMDKVLPPGTSPDGEKKAAG